MGRGSIKQKPINKEFGRRAYVTKDYTSLMRKLSFKAAVNARPEPYSEFEKPYLKNHNYYQMQGLYHSNFRGGVPLLAINPQIPPVPEPEGGVPDVCAHLSIGGAPIGMVFGESHQFNASGGDGNYFYQLFSGPGSISAQGFYTVPLMEGVESSFIVRVGVIDGCRINKGGLSRGLNAFATAVFVIEPPEIVVGIQLSDSFTDTAGTLLFNHTPEIGGSWVDVSGGNEITAFNTVKGSGDSRSYNNTTIANGYIQGDMQILGTIGGAKYIGLEFRRTDDTNKYKCLAAKDEIKLFKVVAGSSTQIGSTHSIAPDDTFYAMKITFNGTSFEVFKDAVSVITTSDSAYSTGTVGIQVRGGAEMDNIEAGA